MMDLVRLKQFLFLFRSSKGLKGLCCMNQITVVFLDNQGERKHFKKLLFGDLAHRRASTSLLGLASPPMPKLVKC